MTTDHLFWHLFRAFYFTRPGDGAHWAYYGMPIVGAEWRRMCAGETHENDWAYGGPHNSQHAPQLGAKLLERPRMRDFESFEIRTGGSPIRPAKLGDACGWLWRLGVCSFDEAVKIRDDMASGVLPLRVEIGGVEFIATLSQPASEDSTDA